LVKDENGRAFVQTLFCAEVTMSSRIVLLIDADATSVGVATAALGKEAEVVVARTREVALLIAGKRPPAVVVIDESLLEGPPFRLIQQMLALSPEMRTVVLSSSDDAARAAHLSLLGPVLKRPVEPAKLRQLVRRALQFSLMASGIRKLIPTPPLQVDGSRQK
jgi:DNA-binding NtrC family response regulator